MKGRDYDQTKKILENWLAEAEDKQENVSWKEDVSFLLESMKDRSYPDEEYLGEELLSYLTSQGEGGEKYPRDVVLAAPSQQEENHFFEQLNQVLKVENGSLGKWPSKEEAGIRGEVFLHLALRKGREDAFENNGRMLSFHMDQKEERFFLQNLFAEGMVERAFYLAKYEDPDWAFDTHKFLNGEREDKTYSSQAEMWYGLKEEKLADHGILYLFEDHRRMEKVLEDYFGKELLDSGKAGNPAGAAMLGTEADCRSFYEKVLQPLEKNAYSSKEKIVEQKNQYAKAREEFLKQLEVVKGLQKSLGEFQFKSIRMLSDWELREKALADAKSVIEHHQKLIKDAETVRDGFTADRKELDGDLEELGRLIEEETGKLKDLEKEINENKTKVTEGYAKEEETLKSVGFMTKLLSKKKYDAAVELAEQYHKAAGEASDLELKLSKDARDLGKKMHERLELQEQLEEKRNNLTEEIGKRSKDITSWTQIIAKQETVIEETEALLREVKEQYEKLLEGMKKEGEKGRRVILDKPYLRRLFSENEKEQKDAQAQIPWITPEYNAEREKLFRLAEKMCEEFVRGSHHFREDLITLEQYLGLRMGDDGKRISFHPMDMASMVPGLYQVLSLFTPVIAMTTDEAGSAFKDIRKPGVFGRLVLDAGAEAAPPKLVGALFKSRQANLIKTSSAEKGEPSQK